MDEVISFLITATAIVTLAISMILQYSFALAVDDRLDESRLSRSDKITYIVLIYSVYICVGFATIWVFNAYDPLVATIGVLLYLVLCLVGVPRILITIKTSKKSH